MYGGIHMKKNYLTVDEAKKYLKLAKSTIYTYVQQKKMPHIKIGERVLFDEDDLNEWVKSKKKRGGQKKTVKATEARS
jgi:excisionase family DNA binding protein